MSSKGVKAHPQEAVPPGQAHLERARALVPALTAAADRIEAERELPTDVLEGMFEAELVRLTLPRFLGGADSPPPIHVTGQVQ
jgi:hypothetical protein